MSTSIDKQWEELQERTRKVAAVKEAVHLLDVCWHDLDVMKRYFKEHGALDADFEEYIDFLMKPLGEKSGHYEQWLLKETPKLDAAIAAMDTTNDK